MSQCDQYYTGPAHNWFFRSSQQQSGLGVKPGAFPSRVGAGASCTDSRDQFPVCQRGSEPASEPLPCHHGHPGQEGAHPPPERPEQAHHQERDRGQLRQGGAGGHLHRGQSHNIFRVRAPGRKYYIFVVSEAVNFRDTETNCSDNYKWNVIIKSLSSRHK